MDFAASDWYNKIPVSLFQTSNSWLLMISGFVEPWKPVFTHFILPKCFRKYKKIMGTSWENIMFANTDIKNFEKFQRYVYHFLRISFLNYIIRRWGSNKFPLIKSRKAWIWISYLSKNMKWKFGNMYQISSENIEHFVNPMNFSNFKEGNHPILNSR